MRVHGEFWLAYPKLKEFWKVREVYEYAVKQKGKPKCEAALKRRRLKPSI